MSDCLVSVNYVSLFVVMGEWVFGSWLPQGLVTLPCLVTLYYLILTFLYIIGCCFFISCFIELLYYISSN